MLKCEGGVPGEKFRRRSPKEVLRISSRERSVKIRKKSTRSCALRTRRAEKNLEKVVSCDFALVVVFVEKRKF
jgi:hypothetical protein